MYFICWGPVTWNNIESENELKNWTKCLKKKINETTILLWLRNNDEEGKKRTKISKGNILIYSSMVASQNFFLTEFRPILLAHLYFICGNNEWKKKNTKSLHQHTLNQHFMIWLSSSTSYCVQTNPKSMSQYVCST